jgi:hypothetical protein
LESAQRQLVVTILKFNRVLTVSVFLKIIPLPLQKVFSECLKGSDTNAIVLSEKFFVAKKLQVWTDDCEIEDHGEDDANSPRSVVSRYFLHIRYNESNLSFNFRAYKSATSYSFPQISCSMRKSLLI